ncbi:MAG: hypothetical protein KC766_42025 [Myxococcales bacterium]|nr:hypothetical protein [Myxococcales bacterium]
MASFVSAIVVAGCGDEPSATRFSQQSGGTGSASGSSGNGHGGTAGSAAAGGAGGTTAAGGAAGSAGETSRPGDGVCSGDEDADTTPEDCPAVAGDGLCTHDEDAGSTPEDCPAVAGDGLCTHDESPLNTPSDCPTVAGDGICSGSENAGTTPSDCPANPSDGFCTHDETFETTKDCPAPDVTFGGGTLDDLRKLSAPLLFNTLTIDGRLTISPADGSVILEAQTIAITRQGSIVSEQGICDWADSPSLVLVGRTAVEVLGMVDLSGKNGKPGTSTASCNLPHGKDGGDLQVFSEMATLGGSIDVRGGDGGYTRDSYGGTVFQWGGDGGDGGDVKFEASMVYWLGFSVNVSGGAAGSGDSSSTNGSPGAPGVKVLPPGVTIVGSP